MKRRVIGEGDEKKKKGPCLEMGGVSSPEKIARNVRPGGVWQAEVGWTTSRDEDQLESKSLVKLNWYSVSSMLEQKSRWRSWCIVPADLIKIKKLSFAALHDFFMVIFTCEHLSLENGCKSFEKIAPSVHENMDIVSLFTFE